MTRSAASRETAGADPFEREMMANAYRAMILEARPGPLRRRRQLKMVREFESKYGTSELRRWVCG